MRKRFYILSALAVAGIFIADHLVQVHAQTVWANAGDSGLCGGEGFSCAEAAKSAYSSIAGLPVAVLNQAFFFTLLVLAGIGRFKPELLPRLDDALYASTLLAVLACFFMAGVSAFVLEHWCPWCIALYAVNLGAFLTVAATHPKGFLGPLRDVITVPASKAFFAALGLMVVGTLAGQGLYAQRAQAAKAAFEKTRAQLPQKPVQMKVEAGEAPGRGPADAEVVIVEFSDFECPYCRRLADSLAETVKKSDVKVRYHFKHYPMDQACNPQVKKKFHENACNAAAASICAGRQGRFWEMHDLMFANQRKLAPAQLESYAGELGIDVEAFKACLVDPAVVEQIRADIAQGLEKGVRGTPTFFVNGWRHEGTRPPEKLLGIIRQAASQGE